jgi:DNA-binding NtrC family response regulator
MLDYESVREFREYSGLKEEIAALARKRIRVALVLCEGNKTRAAALLGLPSYQTLTNWIKQYDVEESDND